MTGDNGLCVCVVKPHGVSDKPLGVAVLHGSEGRRMTADILCFDEESTQVCASTETWVLPRDNQCHPTLQKANIQGHLLPELRI